MAAGGPDALYGGPDRAPTRQRWLPALRVVVRGSTKAHSVRAGWGGWLSAIGGCSLAARPLAALPASPARPGAYAGEGELDPFGRPALPTLQQRTTQQRPNPSTASLAKKAPLVTMHDQQTPVQWQQPAAGASRWLIWRSIVISKTPPPQESRPPSRRKKETSLRVSNPVSQNADVAATGIFEPWIPNVTYVCRDDVHINFYTLSLAHHRRDIPGSCLLGGYRSGLEEYMAYLARGLDLPERFEQ
jgi:hypothetical protein